MNENVEDIEGNKGKEIICPYTFPGQYIFIPCHPKIEGALGSLRTTLIGKSSFP